MDRPRCAARGTGLSRLLVLGAALLFVAVPFSTGRATSGPSLPSVVPPRASEGGAAPAAAPSAGPVLTSPGADPTAIALQWTSAAFISNYTVYESTNGSGGPWTAVGATTNSGTPALTVTSITPGAPYWFQEVTYPVLGASSASNVLADVQPTLAYLTVTSPTSSTAVLNWTNNASYGGPIVFTSYTVYETVNGGAPSSLGTLTNVTHRSWNVSGLAPSTSYGFFVNTTDCVDQCGTASAVGAVAESNVVTTGTPRPLVASIGVERTVVDAGQSDYFTCTPTGGRSPYAFAWDRGNGTYVPGPAGMSASFASSGNPQVTCLVKDSGGTNSSAALAVLVNPAPTLTVTENRSAADTGQSIGFSCTPSGGTPPFELFWSFGDGASGSGPNASHAYASAGPFAPGCSAVDLAGDTVLDTDPMTITTAPTATLAASATAAAPNTTLWFNVSLQNGSAPFSNQLLNFGDGTLATGSGAAHVYHQVGNYTVAGRARDANGFPVRSTVLVRIGAIALQVSAPGTGLSAGTSYTFRAAASGGAGGPFRYAWTFGDGSAGVGLNATAHAFPSAGTFHVSLKATDRLGAAVYRNLTYAVQPAPTTPTSPALTWWLLVPAILLGVAVALFARRWYGLADRRALAGAAQYVLPTDPGRTITGVRTCRNCGTTNSAVRETCGTCGATLPRSFFD